MTTYNTSHYTALMTRLSNEKGYLAVAKSQPEIELRTVWIKQIEKEIEQEAEFLKSKGVDVYQATSDNTLSDEDLLNELFGDTQMSTIKPVLHSCITPIHQTH